MQVVHWAHSAEGAEHLCIWPLMCPNPSPSSSIFKALLMVWRTGMPPPAFTEVVWVSDYLIPYLLGGSLYLSCEKLLCPEKDHRLTLHGNLYLKYVRDTSMISPGPPCQGTASSVSRRSPLWWEVKARNALPAVSASQGSVCSSPPYEGPARSLSPMAVRLSVTVIRLSLIPAGEA